MSPTASKGPRTRPQRKYTGVREPQGVVTMYVGNKIPWDEYYIHKGVICGQSDFFHTAFHSKLKEGETQTMVLDDIPFGVFGIFTKYLYEKKFSDGKEDMPNTFELVQLWNLGERFMMPDLQDMAIKDIHARPDLCHGNVLEILRSVYPDTPSGSPLRRLIAAKFTWESTASKFSELKRQVPRGLLEDMGEITMRSNDERWPVKYRGQVPPADNFLIGSQLV